jgi:ABC-type spermidine/putrescine transport system permease subunit II
MVDVVLVVPTVALGLSLGMFWGKADEILILTAAHLSFTYPYVVKPITAAVGGLRKDLEEAASSLGATPLKVLTTVAFPLILPSILAGAMMAFMRSLSETGATLAVSEKIKTVPVLIVDLVKANMNAEAALASFILLIISLLAVSLLRRK